MIDLDALEQNLITSLEQTLKQRGTECYKIGTAGAHAQRLYLEIPKIGRLYFDRQNAATLFAGRLVKSSVDSRRYQDEQSFNEEGFIQACRDVLEAFITAVQAVDKAVANLISVEAEANLLPF